MPFAEDLDVFFDPDEFGSAALYLPTGAAEDAEPVTVNGIFDNVFVTAEGLVEDANPTFTCRTSDVAGARHGARLTIGDTAYKVVGVEPDGTGVTRLQLQLQDPVVEDEEP